MYVQGALEASPSSVLQLSQMLPLTSVPVGLLPTSPSTLAKLLGAPPFLNVTRCGSPSTPWACSKPAASMAPITHSTLPSSLPSRDSHESPLQALPFSGS